MNKDMAIAVRAVHQLDLQTHAYQEDGDAFRIAASIALASRLLVALNREAKLIGLDNEIAYARALAKCKRSA